MAKILVADDNSNIQKMVGLALKDEGIDVVAVGNGEAAVRKISDVKPDLVLADVFMPVRNGYEVCKYVKNDSALSHIPVILLVGAFDPLDEQEAQRVGADGVLKKPFVPPDPLISMVKSALDRAGVSLKSAPAPEPEPTPAAEPFKPLALRMPQAIEAEEAPIDDIPARPAPINIDRGAQPLAFGSLLDTQTPEEEDTSSLVSPVRMERDWKSSSEEEQMDVEEEEEDSGSGWRPGGMELDDVPAGKKDWREAAFAEKPEQPAKPAYEAEPAPPAPVAASEPEPVGVAQNGLPNPFMTDATWSVKNDGPSESASVTANEPEKAAEVPMPEPSATPSTNDSWLSIPPSPWDAEAAKASKLAATWDSAIAVAPEPERVETPAAKHEPSINDTIAMLPAETTAVLHEEAAEVIHAAQAPSSSATPESAVSAEPNVDDMVAKVIAKLDPSALQALTKELLKPVIESVVREELQKK